MGQRRRWKEFGVITVYQDYDVTEDRVWMKPLICADELKNATLTEAVKFLANLEKAATLALKWNRDTGKKQK